MSVSNPPMGKNRKGRDLTGIFLLNKDKSMSSNYALQKVKRIFNAKKAGHTGSLDPLATGVLPICLGEATKFSNFFLNADKKYQVKLVLGVETDTYDSEGQIVAESSTKNISKSSIQGALKKFKGNLRQVPPMFSAIKLKGKPLYKYARQGVSVERKAREICIYDIKLLSFRQQELMEVELFLHVSKGTYIRSFAHDLGEYLGSGAHVSALHRIEVGQFTEKSSVKLLDIEQSEEIGDLKGLENKILSLESVMREGFCIDVSNEEGTKFCLGQSVIIKESFPICAEAYIVRVFNANGRFLGTGRLDNQGLLSPKRVVCIRE